MTQAHLKDIVKNKFEKIKRLESKLLLNENEGIKKMNFLKLQICKNEYQLKDNHWSDWDSWSDWANS